MESKLSRVTSREAVVEAIQECNRMGRDEFLHHYGYKQSRRYPLHYEGQIYDSKAILGVAFGKQHGNPLLAREFSGGLATVVPTLLRLSFSAHEATHPAEYLSIGTTYLRKELRELYGGQLQKGIWTPKEFPVVFIFSGESGEAYGYKDGWSEDGVFKYTGEGQSGDMTFTTGNEAIRDHRKNGKDLLLFLDLGKGKGVRYSGLFECASWEEGEGKDKDNKQRKTIVFNLIHVTASVSAASQYMLDEDSYIRSVSLKDLRNAAYSASKTEASPSNDSGNKRSWYERSKLVRNYVLARASGICEACDEEAPFIRKNGTPYLEPHHTTRLADEGPDHPAWVGAICPNCHRRIHSGIDGVDWNNRLKKQLQSKEAAFEDAT